MEKERKHHAYSTDLKGSHEDIADLGHSVEKSLLSVFTIRKMLLKSHEEDIEQIREHY